MDIEHENAARRDSDLIMTTELNLILPTRPFLDTPKPVVPSVNRLDNPGAQDMTPFPNLLRALSDQDEYRKVMAVRDLLNSPSPAHHPVWQLPSTSEAEVDSSFARAQEWHHLLHSLYGICQYASSTYINYGSPQARISLPYWQPILHPYSDFPQPRESSLMDNISTICTHLWRKARSDLMAPRRAEADAVRDMRDLYAWGEAIVRGVEGNCVSSDDRENGSLLECAGMGEVASFGHAAKKLCEWFGDADAWTRCVEIVDELEELEYLDSSERMSCD